LKVRSSGCGGGLGGRAQVRTACSVRQRRGLAGMHSRVPLPPGRAAPQGCREFSTAPLHALHGPCYAPAHLQRHSWTNVQCWSKTRRARAYQWHQSHAVIVCKPVMATQRARSEVGRGRVPGVPCLRPRFSPHADDMDHCLRGVQVLMLQPWGTTATRRTFGRNVTNATSGASFRPAWHGRRTGWHGGLNLRGAGLPSLQQRSIWPPAARRDCSLNPDTTRNTCDVPEEVGDGVCSRRCCVAGRTGGRRIAWASIRPHPARRRLQEWKSTAPLIPLGTSNAYASECATSAVWSHATTAIPRLTSTRMPSALACPPPRPAACSRAG
jgi:hypothetical protein